MCAALRRSPRHQQKSPLSPLLGHTFATFTLYSQTSTNGVIEFTPQQLHTVPSIENWTTLSLIATAATTSVSRASCCQSHESMFVARASVTHVHRHTIWVDIIFILLLRYGSGTVLVCHTNTHTNTRSCTHTAHNRKCEQYKNSRNGIDIRIGQLVLFKAFACCSVVSASNARRCLHACLNRYVECVSKIHFAYMRCVPIFWSFSGGRRIKNVVLVDCDACALGHFATKYMPPSTITIDAPSSYDGQPASHPNLAATIQL